VWRRDHYCRCPFPDEFSGQVQNISDTRADHIPGATSLPDDTLHDSDNNRLKPAATLAGLISAAMQNASNTIACCNIGVLGSVDWFVLSPDPGPRPRHALRWIYGGMVALRPAGVDRGIWIALRSGPRQEWHSADDLSEAT
jgi:hypothetical protein